MNTCKFLTLTITLAWSFAVSSAFGDEVTVRTPSGDHLTLSIEPEETFINVIAQIENHLNTIATTQDDNAGKGSTHPYLLDFMANDFKVLASISENTSQGKGRDYYRPVTKDEKDDIRYIVTTLAQSPWTKLMSSKSSLKRAGDRVQDLHPLKFLWCIFSEEELKVGIRNIRSRGGRVWSGFFDGLSESLSDESKVHNISLEFLEDFAKSLEFDVSAIISTVEKERWSDLVDLLIELIPRKGNPARYDM